MKRFLLEQLHLAGLLALAVAEPVYSLLRGAPEVLMARSGDPALNARLLVVLLSALLPLVPAIINIAVRRLSVRWYGHLYRVWVGVFVALLSLHLIRDLGWPPLLLAGFAAVAGLVVGAVSRRPSVRFGFNLLALGAVLSPLLFLSAPRIKELLAARDLQTTAVDSARATPLVIVVFDELQLASLLDRDGGINAGLYPNFARLAERSNWYVNASSVSAGTGKAIPAILTGHYPPDERKSPIWINHPDNLFTLLGKSHHWNAIEVLTRLCPLQLCEPEDLPILQLAAGLGLDAGAVYLQAILPPSWASRFPRVDQTWGGFWTDGDALFPGGWLAVAKQAVKSDRARLFRKFVAGIQAGPAPTAHFLHVLLPHLPLSYYPNGQRYLEAGLYHVGSQAELHDPWQVTRGYQRQILQTVFVDRLVGELWQQLEREGMLEDVLLVVMADHGVHYQPGKKRRELSPESLDDVLRVPLFVKLPGQKDGLRDTRAAQTIDVLPTILDIQHAVAPDGLDGQSLLLPDTGVAASRRAQTVQGKWHDDWVSSPLAQAFAPSGVVPRLSWVADPDQLYGLGRWKGLLGEMLLELSYRDATAERQIWIQHEDQLLAATPSDDPGYGYIHGAHLNATGPIDLALAVNGRIVDVSRSHQHEDKEWHFRFLIAPKWFRTGGNELKVFAIAGKPEEPGLRLIYSK